MRPCAPSKWICAFTLIAAVGGTTRSALAQPPKLLEKAQRLLNLDPQRRAGIKLLKQLIDSDKMAKRRYRDLIGENQMWLWKFSKWLGPAAILTSLIPGGDPATASKLQAGGTVITPYAYGMEIAARNEAATHTIEGARKRGNPLLTDSNLAILRDARLWNGPTE